MHGISFESPDKGAIDFVHSKECSSTFKAFYRGQSWRSKTSANLADPRRTVSNWASRQIFLLTSNFEL